MLIILSDSREQNPLCFDGLEGVDKVSTIGLPVGDYGAVIDGKTVPIFFDRKSIGDLFGTMTHGYERWKRLMKKAKDLKVKLILITEGTYSDVLKGYSHSEYSGDAMVKKLATLSVKYDLEWWPCDGREEMAHRIATTFSAIQRFWSKSSSLKTSLTKEK